MLFSTFYGNYSKEDFIRRCNLEIRMIETCDKARQIAFKVLKTFNGKVVNTKLANAIQAELDSEGIETWCYLDKLENNRALLALVPKNNSDNSYTVIYSSYKLRIGLLLSQGNRLDIDKTLNGNSNPSLAEETKIKIKLHKDAIKNFDKYINLTDKLRKQVVTYKNKCNFLLTEQIPLF